MKIVYCIPWISTSGGVERVTSIKANWLVDKGYDVSVICGEEWKGSFFSYDDRVQLHSAAVPSLCEKPKFLRLCETQSILHPFLSPYRRYLWIKEKNAYLKLFEKIQPDIIVAKIGHLILIEAMLAYRAACQNRPVRLVLEAHGYRWNYEDFLSPNPTERKPEVLANSLIKSVLRKLGGGCPSAYCGGPV